MEWGIFPLDVLFFRGSSPMNAGEGGFITGLFPPSPEMVQGLVRSTLLSALGVPFHEYADAVKQPGAASARGRDAVALLGAGGDLGRLQLRGPYLIRERGSMDAPVWQRWYPAPLDLRRQESGWRAVGPGRTVETDLGRVRLLAPTASAAADGAPASDRPADAPLWIDEVGLARYLAGEIVPHDAVADAHTFYVAEPRVGIGRDPTTRTAREAMLFAPSFVRLVEQDGRVGIAVRVDGVEPSLERQCAGVQRFGGEGRLVEIVVAEAAPPPSPPPLAERARLVALTPTRWEGGWLPGLDGGEGPWPATLGDISLTVISGAIGKPVRIGGWDIMAGKPKPAAACVPAGSVWYVEAPGAGLARLHDTCIGTRKTAGFGHLLVGAWREGGEG